MWATLITNMYYLSRQSMGDVDDWPTLSVIIPARNEDSTIGRLLLSLAEQDYPAFDIIVYNDASEDSTAKVVQAFAASHPGLQIELLDGKGPPEGWIGKVHALYAATRNITSDRLLFLDADTRLIHPRSLRNLVTRHESYEKPIALTGLTRLRGKGMLLVSMIPNSILTGLPWIFTPHTKMRSIGAVNGQCWMVDSATYFQYEPHEKVKNEVLEDVMIGRYFLENGVTPVLANLQNEIEVFMYGSMGDAWRGFRKNAYLIVGGKPISFILLQLHFILMFLVSPFVHIVFLASTYLLKLTTDTIGRMPLRVTVLAPVSYFLAAMITMDSAFSTWTGRVQWKGRGVG